ncbi:MAG TPA: cytochrome c [Baekduia sp.]|nr:cytochrome c [Baekduia sp.]
MRVPRFASVLAAAALALGAAACGDDDEGGDAAAPPASAASGKKVFTDRCASCHTLADAGAEGRLGPNLDETNLDTAAIEQQVREGGGSMPAFEGSLSDDEITSVATYVTEAKGG